jgi:hypothetical protein
MTQQIRGRLILDGEERAIPQLNFLTATGSPDDGNGRQGCGHPLAALLCGREGFGIA